MLNEVKINIFVISISLQSIYVTYFFINFQGALHPQPKFSMFCNLSQNYQPFLKNINACHSKLSKELKHSNKILVGQVGLELLIKTLY